MKRKDLEDMLKLRREHIESSGLIEHLEHVAVVKGNKTTVPPTESYSLKLKDYAIEYERRIVKRISKGAIVVVRNKTKVLFEAQNGEMPDKPTPQKPIIKIGGWTISTYLSGLWEEKIHDAYERISTDVSDEEAAEAKKRFGIE
jgi:hypothetical protein